MQSGEESLLLCKLSVELLQKVLLWKSRAGRFFAAFAVGSRAQNDMTRFLFIP